MRSMLNAFTEVFDYRFKMLLPNVFLFRKFKVALLPRILHIERRGAKSDNHRLEKQKRNRGSHMQMRKLETALAELFSPSLA